jgi:ParB/RepB/Spo0J family partition protein
MSSTAPVGVKLSAMSATLMPLAQIVPSKTNPRKTFTAADIAELAENIKKRGVIQAILLRPHPTKSGAFEIVCGERRYRASKEAGLTDVPVDVRDLSDDEVIEIQLIENLMRRDLTALEEAAGYNAMVGKKYTHERIAEKVGRSAQYVRDRCRLLDLVKGAAELLEAKKIEVGHAILLSRLKPDDQVRTIREPKAGAFGPERESGLWQRQRDIPDTSQGAAGDRDELKPVSVRELAAWIQDHIRLDPEVATAQADLFPDIAGLRAAAIAAKVEGDKGPKVVEITTSHMLNDDTRDPKRRVLGARSWVRADGKAGSKTCASSVFGIVVAGDGQGEAFKVCIDKKACQVHYKSEIVTREKRARAVAKSGKTGEDRHALEEKKRKEAEAKEAAEVKRFEAARPAMLRALADRIKAMPVKVTGPVVGAVSNAVNSIDYRHTELDKILPPGKTVDDRLRHLAFIVAGSHAWGYRAQDSFQRTAKAFGVDIAKILAAQSQPKKQQ